jgi:hypothetical protein
MRTNNIELTARATRLYHELVGSTQGGPHAIHVVWDVTAGDGFGVWKVGLTPESHFQAVDPQLLDKVVAGRIDGILIVIDGPIARPASDLSIRIDTTLKADDFIVAID